MKHIRSVSAVVPAAVIAVGFLFTACGKENQTTTEISYETETVSITKSASFSEPGSDSKSTSSYTIADFNAIAPPEPTEYTYTMRLASLPGETHQGGHFYHLVEAYNRVHPDRAIEIVPLYNSASISYEMRETAKIQLAADIANGNGPDILVLDKEGLADYCEKERLASIDELSPTLKSELIPGVVELGTINDKFVGIAAYIDKIYTNVIPEKYYSAKTWTIHDILDIMAGNPDLKRTFVARKEFNSYDKPAKNFIAYGLEYADSGFVDYETNTAHFYCEDFVLLLEQILKDSKNPDDFGFDRSTYLAQYMEFSKPIDLLKQLVRAEDGYTFVGIPSENNPGNRFSASLYVAVNKDCKEMDSALEFLKEVMYCTPEYRLPVTVTGRSIKFEEPAKPGTAGKLSYEIADKAGYYNPFVSGLYYVCDYAGDPDVIRSSYEDFMINLKPCESDQYVLDALLFNIKEFITYGGDADAYAKRIEQTVQSLLDGNYTVQP